MSGEDQKVVEYHISIHGPLPSGYGGPNGIMILADVPVELRDKIEEEFHTAVWDIIEGHGLAYWTPEDD